MKYYNLFNFSQTISGAILIVFTLTKTRDVECGNMWIWFAGVLKKNIYIYIYILINRISLKIILITLIFKL